MDPTLQPKSMPTSPLKPTPTPPPVFPQYNPPRSTKPTGAIQPTTPTPTPAPTPIPTQPTTSAPVIPPATNPIHHPTNNPHTIAATEPIAEPEPAPEPDPIAEALKEPFIPAAPVPGSIGSAVSVPKVEPTPPPTPPTPPPPPTPLPPTPLPSTQPLPSMPSSQLPPSSQSPQPQTPPIPQPQAPSTPPDTQASIQSTGPTNPSQSSDFSSSPFPRPQPTPSVAFNNPIFESTKKHNKTIIIILCAIIGVVLLSLIIIFIVQAFNRTDAKDTKTSTETKTRTTLTCDRAYSEEELKQFNYATSATVAFNILFNNEQAKNFKKTLSIEYPDAFIAASQLQAIKTEAKKQSEILNLVTSFDQDETKVNMTIEAPVDKINKDNNSFFKLEIDDKGIVDVSKQKIVTTLENDRFFCQTQNP